MINLESGEMSPLIPVQAQPERIALTPDGKRAYVVNLGSGSVSVIDIDLAKIIATVAVGKLPFNVLVSRDGYESVRRQREVRFDLGDRYSFESSREHDRHRKRPERHDVQPGRKEPLCHECLWSQHPSDLAGYGQSSYNEISWRIAGVHQADARRKARVLRSALWHDRIGAKTLGPSKS